ncbi:histidine kinase dimerization/phosphoacceptor domain -containing protein [Fodinibius sp. SL11]|uniref:histidine kinase dimerization/phosphoacceptor domain -containing protein n=1 Tax=Fodinibius sp. SL11 TaxID=3425690 RepID=UPI003F883B5A
MESPKFPIRWKLLSGFIGLALLVLVVVLFAVSQILDNRIREDINSSFHEAGKIFEQLQDVRFRQLRQTATLVADMPYMKAAISTGDPNTINQQIRQELVHLLHFDPLISDTLSSESLTTSLDSVGLVMVFDKNGLPLGQLSDVDPAKKSMSNKLGVQKALEGQHPQQSYIWKQGENYFNVITIPVFLQEQVIAALSLGYPIRNREAELLAQVIGYEVSYYVDDKLLTTSIDSLLSQHRKVLSDGIEQASATEINQTGSTTIEMEMRNQKWLVYLVPMVKQVSQSVEISGYYAVAKSLTQALEPLHQLQRVIYLIGLGGILIAIILGITLTRNLTRPINRLLDGIKRIENDDYDHPVSVESRDEFGQLTRTFNKLVANIKENLREKETLLAEIHHRVKNNLAVISGLLQLESSNVENEHTEQILKNSQLRIQSMATVHEMLYKAHDFNNLSFNDFIKKMVASIHDIYKSAYSELSVEVDVKDIDLNVNQAVPFGLMVNELVTNAFKHAYPDGGSGVVAISFFEEEGNVVLTVEDEGMGLDSDFSLEESESLGFSLIKILSQQIDADVTVESKNGTKVTVVFEKKDKKGSSSSLNLN